MTYLGDDEFLTQLIQQMAQENINIKLVQKLSGRTMGLYCISNDSSRRNSYGLRISGEINAGNMALVWP